jgi:hypothetical protein
MQSHWFRAAAMVATALALSSCESTDAKREDIIKCYGFSLGLLSIQLPVIAEANALLTKQGITGADTVPLGQAAQTYGASMDPAKASRLSKEGRDAATDLIRKNDARGIASYIKACVDTYKDLGR